MAQNKLGTQIAKRQKIKIEAKIHALEKKICKTFKKCKHANKL